MLIRSSWRNNKSAKYPTAKWSGIQNVLEEAESDVLILFDCCASGVANTSSGNPANDLIAACALTPGQMESDLIPSLMRWSFSLDL
jgi:hypothetical protein